MWARAENFLCESSLDTLGPAHKARLATLLYAENSCSTTSCYKNVQILEFFSPMITFDLTDCGSFFILNFLSKFSKFNNSFIFARKITPMQSQNSYLQQQMHHDHRTMINFPPMRVVVYN